MEVSHNIVRLLVNVADRTDTPLAPLLQGLSLDEATLRKKSTALAWDPFSVLVDRLVDAVGYERFEAVATNIRDIAPDDHAVLSSFVGPLTLYRFINSLMVPTLLPMLVVEHQELEVNRFCLTLKLRDDTLRDCETFFRVFRLSQAAIPGFLGQKPALVEAQTTSRGGTYWVTPPKARTLLTRLAATLFGNAPEPKPEPPREGPVWSTRDTSQHRRLATAMQKWQLTPRQTEILSGLVRGLANKEIAQELDCSLKTIETHMTELLKRAGKDSRLALVSAFWREI